MVAQRRTKTVRRTTKGTSAKKRSPSLNEPPANEKFELRPLNEVAEELMLDYSVEVLEDRAIPSYEDGLKPVHRRVLWAMYESGLTDKGKVHKSAKIVGNVIGTYHPHGDSSVYDAMVNRAQSNSYNNLIHGEGNWGTVTDNAAAYRYTECRFSSIGYESYFNPFYVPAIEFVPNFDSTTKEPVVLPAIWPMILAVEQSGIAVAVNTRIPTFTMESVKAVTLHLLKNGKDGKPAKATAKFLAEHLEFASIYGGKMISTKEEVMEALNNPRGSIKWQCDYTIDRTSGVVCIKGIPPQWTLTATVKFFKEHPDIAEFRDLSNETNPVYFELRLKRMEQAKRDALLDIIENKMYSNFTINLNVNDRELDTSTPVPSVKVGFGPGSVVDVLNDWLAWRCDYLEVSAINIHLDILEQKIAKQELLLLAIDSLEIIFQLLRKKGIDKTVELSKRLKISIDDSKYIWSMAVGRLDSLSREDTVETIEKLESEYNQLVADLKDTSKAAYRRNSKSS